jgi:hypothetical protein
LVEAKQWIRGEIRAHPGGHWTRVAAIASALAIALYVPGRRADSQDALLAYALRDAGLGGDEGAVYALYDLALEHGIDWHTRKGPVIDRLAFFLRWTARDRRRHLPAIDATFRQLRQLGILPKKPRKE